MKTYPITLTVNGEKVALEVPARRTLLDLLKNDLHRHSVKGGCGIGECGVCTVILDGRPVNACLVLAVEADGGTVITVEGLAVDGKLSPLQQAFLDKGAVQCGFCTPGQLMAAHALLAENPHPDIGEIQEGLAGNLCRCGCYVQITEAILAAAEEGAR